jgi:hypothetical protein
MLAQSFRAKVVFGREDRQLNKVGTDRYFLFLDSMHPAMHPAMPFVPELYLLLLAHRTRWCTPCRPIVHRHTMHT